MSISTTPPPAPPKKQGMGCLGCGCLVLALLAILFVGLVGGAGYWFYTETIALTSTTPADVPSFEGSDDVYQAAKQKLADFDRDVKNHQAATIQLSADELNTLIARNPAFIQQKVQLFVTLTDDQARMQGSIPTSAFIPGILKGRYLNFDTTFSLDFDSGTRGLDLSLHHLQIGDRVAQQKLLPMMQYLLTPFLNAELQNDPDTKELLDQAKSIEIKDGQLVIETQ